MSLASFLVVIFHTSKVFIYGVLVFAIKHCLAPQILPIVAEIVRLWRWDNPAAAAIFVRELHCQGLRVVTHA